MIQRRLSHSLERRQDPRVRPREWPDPAGHRQRTQHGGDRHRRHQGLQEDPEWRGRGTGQCPGRTLCIRVRKETVGRLAL